VDDREFYSLDACIAVLRPHARKLFEVLTQGSLHPGYDLGPRPYGTEYRDWSWVMLDSGDEIGLRLYEVCPDRSTKFDQLLIKHQILLAEVLLNGSSLLPATTDHLVVFSPEPGVIRMCPMKSFVLTYQ
jgi:hypothetical protein